MYTQIFLLILLILTVNLAPELSSGFWNFKTFEAAALSAILYAGVLFVIFLQNLWWKPKGKTLAASLELIAYFIFIYLILGVQTHFPRLMASDTLLSAVTLFFYLLGLGFSQYTVDFKRKDRWICAKSQVNFLIPFIIPYFTLTITLDLFYVFFGIKEGWVPALTAFLLLMASLLFLPYFIQKFWNCTPLADSQLHLRLESLCKKASFTHGGMNTWSVLPHAITAGIIGVIPRFRYVMFTPKLLEMLAPEQIEAILVHEIGHSKHKHLLLYPLVILGMGVSVALFFVLFDHLLDFSFSPTFAPVLVFVPYALIMWLYFRYIFGFFSRLFERQADLFVFKLKIPPENIISALDHIAIASGNIHHHPSWHHFGIQQRIDYLKKVMETPALIEKHHRKVRIFLTVYFAFLSLGIFFLIWY